MERLNKFNYHISKTYDCIYSPGPYKNYMVHITCIKDYIDNLKETVKKKKYIIFEYSCSVLDYSFEKLLDFFNNSKSKVKTNDAIIYLSYIDREYNDIVGMI